MLCSRFASFISSLENSSKIWIRLLINLLKFDQRSVTEKTLRNIVDKCNKDLNIIKKRIVKNYNKIVINGIDHAELDDIINVICTT